MIQEGETKTCKMCSMGIPANARKCPYCHHWQRWRSLQHPAVVALLISSPVLAMFAVLAMFFNKEFREWEPFAKYSDQVRIVESKMEFGEDKCDPAVVVIGKVENLSPVDWKDVRFHVEFFNSKDELFDTGQQECYTWRFLAEQESSFKISLHRQFPQKEYARYEIRIVSAMDSRQRF